jgi:hypothetical protein
MGNKPILKNYDDYFATNMIKNRKQYKTTLLYAGRKIQKTKRIIFKEIAKAWRIDKLIDWLTRLLNGKTKT